MLLEAVSSAKGLLLLIVAVTLLAVALSSKDSHAPRQQMAEPKLRQTSVEIAPNVFLPMVNLGQSMSHKVLSSEPASETCQRARVRGHVGSLFCAGVVSAGRPWC